jgi:hypothetical protein
VDDRWQQMLDREMLHDSVSVRCFLQSAVLCLTEDVEQPALHLQAAYVKDELCTNTVV